MPTTPASYIRKLRHRLGDEDSDSYIWTDDQLGEWIEAGMEEYTYGARDITAAIEDDVTAALMLAHSSAMYELASNASLFFAWKDQQKEIDKSMTPEMCRRIGKDLWERVMAQRKAKGDNVGGAEEEKDRAQGGIMQMEIPERATRRDWF